MRDKLSIEEDLIADSAEDLNSYAYTQLPKETRRQKPILLILSDFKRLI